MWVSIKPINCFVKNSHVKGAWTIRLLNWKVHEVISDTVTKHEGVTRTDTLTRKTYFLQLISCSLSHSFFIISLFFLKEI